MPNYISLLIKQFKNLNEHVYFYSLNLTITEN